MEGIDGMLGWSVDWMRGWSVDWMWGWSIDGVSSWVKHLRVLLINVANNWNLNAMLVRTKVLEKLIRATYGVCLILNSAVRKSSIVTMRMNDS